MLQLKQYTAAHNVLAWHHGAACQLLQQMQCCAQQQYTRSSGHMQQQIAQHHSPDTLEPRLGDCSASTAHPQQQQQQCGWLVHAIGQASNQSMQRQRSQQERQWQQWQKTAQWQQWRGHALLQQHVRWFHQDTQQQHRQGTQQQHVHAAGTEQQPTCSDSSSSSRQRVPGSSLGTLPNLLSLSRVAMGPGVAAAIATQQWPLAVGITAAAGVTDWLDGYLARRLGHTSKLGSYLDPLSDKIFVATAVGTMGYLGILPAWLAVLVVGRDSTQVAGMFWYRLRMFGGRWPGAAVFFDVDHTVQQQQVQQGQQQQQQQGADPAGTAQLPMIRPLLVSKANTALVMGLVAACMGHEWQGVPGQDVLDTLEYAAASTTLASAAAYAWLHSQGRLLVGSEQSSSKAA